MATIDREKSPILDGLARFAMAPFRVRTYTNALFLALAFPLGLLYFIFLVVGFSVGLGLTLVWVGLPILALVLLGSWAFSAFERQMAIVLLGAPVPPQAPARLTEELEAPRPLLRRLGDYFGNPVTWKGLAYLMVKFPLGIVSFISIVTLGAVSLSFLLAPFAWQFGTFDSDVVFSYGWESHPVLIWLLLPLGLALVWLSLNLLNLLAWVSGWVATFLLGSERFRGGTTPSLPAAPPSPPSAPTGSLDSALPA